MVNIERVNIFDMLDRSWLTTETYEVEIIDIDRDNPFMSLLCASSLDLNDGASTTSLRESAPDCVSRCILQAHAELQVSV